MEPKFQSSFIPKGPVASASPLSDTYSRPRNTLFGYVATIVFTITIIAALGSFAYDRYLLAHLGTLGNDLTAARQSLDPDSINTLVRADQRIISTRNLLAHHIALSPFFDYLETATLKNVRFTEFIYQTSDKGLTLSMHGLAKSYTDVALQSDAFNKAGFFKDPVFSDLDLDTKGNVVFTFRTTLDPAIVSYKKRLEGENIAFPVVSVQPAQTASTTSLIATTTPKVATTTPKSATSTITH